ncbi:hypothetical protein [Pseudonocardia pini]|uniref:hypothetical protein n=1 Tax=Pseudonocardia pini TaxID=2758030 RepID=UPI0015F10F39|nr:hypothetical protein [Pseudonocardia pini]
MIGSGPRIVGAAVVASVVLLLTAGPADAQQPAAAQNVFVEFEDTAAAADFEAALPQGRDVARRIAERTRDRIDSRVADVLAKLRGSEGQR